MNKGEPAKLARLPAFATKSIWNAPSTVTLLRKGIAFRRGEFNISRRDIGVSSHLGWPVGESQSATAAQHHTLRKWF